MCLVACLLGFSCVFRFYRASIANSKVFICNVALFLRMESATLEQSSVASEAVVTSFFECLRFALLYGKAQQSDTSLGLSDDIRKCLLCDHVGIFSSSSSVIFQYCFLFSPLDVEGSGSITV